MKLLESAEPIFQYVCRLNRLGRHAGKAVAGDTSFFSKGSSPAPASASKTANIEYAVVRGEVKVLLDDFLKKGGGDSRMSDQLTAMELPLIFFIDSMLAESSLPLAGQWNQNRLAYDRNELAGDEKFFDLLEETMKDSRPEASERLAVFYVCIGLGFTGIYFNQPEYLRKTMLTIAPRIRQSMEVDQNARMCPEAYEGVDTRDLIQPPGSRMALLGIIFLCFILAVLVTYFLMYSDTKDALLGSMNEIIQNDLTPNQP